MQPRRDIQDNKDSSTRVVSFREPQTSDGSRAERRGRTPGSTPSPNFVREVNTTVRTSIFKIPSEPIIVTKNDTDIGMMSRDPHEMMVEMGSLMAKYAKRLGDKMSDDRTFKSIENMAKQENLSEEDAEGEMLDTVHHKTEKIADAIPGPVDSDTGFSTPYGSMKNLISGRIVNDPLRNAKIIEGMDGAFKVKVPDFDPVYGQGDNATNFGIVGCPVVAEGSMIRGELLVEKLSVGNYMKGQHSEGLKAESIGIKKETPEGYHHQHQKQGQPKDTNNATGPIEKRQYDSIVIASGPYVCGEIDMYEMFERFQALRCDVLILIGPFSPKPRNADESTKREGCSPSCVARALKDLVDKCPEKKIILVSGPNCDLCDLVYPQNKTIAVVDGVNLEIHCNPCIISLGELKLTISSSSFNSNVEILSLENNYMPSRKFEQIAQTILATNCPYPMCPPNLVHPVHYSRLVRVEVGQPDILVLPARAMLCSVDIGGTYCVNPGFVQLGYMCCIKVEEGALVISHKCV